VWPLACRKTQMERLSLSEVLRTCSARQPILSRYRDKVNYFGIGMVERDEVEDYAARKSWSIEAERWLSPVLNYDPKPARTAAV
jgi:hypothetical protein